jgi:hypothetical protein
MIISHKYKYIFLKTTKTAGTSVEISLSRFCGESDLITPIVASDEKIRQDLGVFPRNYIRPFRLQEYRPRHIINWLKTGKKPEVKFWNHAPASFIKEHIEPEIWNSYFKFCFVRNPWDRAISRYYWNIKKTGKAEDLDESLKNNEPNSNWQIYTIDDRLAVDYVGKFENLTEDLNFVCQKLNIPFDAWMPQAKGNIRKDKRHYSEVLNERQAEYIREKCAGEIELFDYKF